jgi:hypothetical protein
MVTPIFLAQFWGWMLVITGAVLLFRSDAFLKDLSRLVSEDKGFAVSTGYLSLVMGLGSLLIYRAWSADVMVIVTIFGWLATLKGVMRLGFPGATKTVAGYFVKQPAIGKILLVVVVFLGLWLLVATR